jgi:hypothetical protein
MVPIPHGLGFYQILGLELTTVQAEAAAADIKEYPMPFHGEVIAFGAYITEDFIAQATDAVVSLTNSSKIGGTDTELKALTIGADNTALKKGNDTSGANANLTAIAADTDLDNGHVVLASLVGVNRKFQPGDVLQLRAKVAASGAGGAYTPFVLVKFSGIDMTSSKVWREVESTLY